MSAPASPVSGTAGSVAVVSGGTTVVEAVKQWTLNIARNTIDISAMGDSWKVFLNSLGEWDGSFMLWNDAGAAGQALTRGAVIGGSAAVTYRFYAGTQYYSGSVIVTGASPELAHDGAWGTGHDFQGSGPIAYTG